MEISNLDNSARYARSEGRYPLGRLRRVLILSPRFPPTSAPDLHRVRQCLPYLRDLGWEPTVLAVDPADCDFGEDPLLVETIPADIPVVRVPSSRRFGFNGLDLRAYKPLANAGDRLLNSGRFDLVFISTTAFTLAALGQRWKRKFGVPFVIDLQDPWVTDHYDKVGAPPPPGGRIKYALAKRIAKTLERQTMREVGHIVSVSPSYPRELMARYSSLREDQFTVLPFGAPRADIEVLQRQKVRQRIFDPADGLEHWVYVGVVGPLMRFAVTALLRALGSARAADPVRFERVRLHFVGTAYADGDRGHPSVTPIASACGVSNMVEEQTQRVPYFEALACLRDASAILAVGTDDPAYTASKLYPYLITQKPMLAVYHAESSVHDVMKKVGGATVVAFRPEEDIADVAERVKMAWMTSPSPPRVPLDHQAFEPYTAHGMTRTLCSAFNRTVMPSGASVT